MINPARLDEIHSRLAVGDPTASADLFEEAYDGLTGYVLKGYRRFGLSQDQAKDLAVAVLAKLSLDPASWDPDKGKGLLGYLFMAVDADAKTLTASERGRREKMSLHAVEVREIGGTSYVEDPSIGMDARRIMDTFGPEIIQGDGDEAVLRLMLDGVRETSAYAEALGIGHLSEAGQKDEVKRRKDRLEARIRRVGRKL